MNKHIEELLDQALKEYEELEDKNNSAIDFCLRYLKLNLELFNPYDLLRKIIEILKGDKENETN